MPIVRHGYSNQRAHRRRQYDSPHHRSTRARLKPLADAGLLTCARCGNTIRPGEPWDLDHTNDRTRYLGASHATCNRARRGAHPRGEGGASKTHPPHASPPRLFAKHTA